MLLYKTENNDVASIMENSKKMLRTQGKALSFLLHLTSSISAWMNLTGADNRTNKEINRNDRKGGVRALQTDSIEA